jgi:hypothetical protein
MEWDRAELCEDGLKTDGKFWHEVARIGDGLKKKTILMDETLEFLSSSIQLPGFALKETFPQSEVPLQLSVMKYYGAKGIRSRKTESSTLSTFD